MNTLEGYNTYLVQMSGMDVPEGGRLKAEKIDLRFDTPRNTNETRKVKLYNVSTWPQKFLLFLIIIENLLILFLNFGNTIISLKNGLSNNTYVPLKI